MMLNNHNVSTNRATYNPFSSSILMGSQSSMKTDNSLYDGGTRSHFQKYRNETLSKFTMPPYEWGINGIPYSLEPHVTAINKVRNNYDRSLDSSSNIITTIDADRMQELDDLYKVTQMQRQQYKNNTGSLHSLDFFKTDQYMFQCSPSLQSSYFSKYPEYYTKYKVPLVLPLTYERMLKTPYIPDLAFPGIYNLGNCIAYKR